MKEKTKTCSKCKEEKPLDSFYKNKNSKDGLNHWCKECSSIYQKNKRQHNKKLKTFNNLESKICSHCKEEKSTKLFTRDIGNENGFKNSCKECDKKSKIKTKEKYNELISKIGIPTTKKCCSCKEEKPFFSFHKNKNVKDGYNNKCKICRSRLNREVAKPNFEKGTKLCTKCNKEKDLSLFYKRKNSNIGYSSQCKECKNKREINKRRKNNPKKYELYDFIKNIRDSVQEGFKFCSRCVEVKSIDLFCSNKSSSGGLSNTCKDCNKIFRTENKDKIKKYRKENRDDILRRGKESRESPVNYSTYYSKLTMEEDPIEDKNGLMMCRCTYCKEYFYPNMSAVRSRIRCLENDISGECRLYCCDGHKQKCDIFYANLIPKSLRDNASKARCNQSRVRQILLSLQVKQFGYSFCEKCGNKFPPEELFFHHNVPIADDPNEYDNAAHYMIVCQEHHKHEGCLNK